MDKVIIGKIWGEDLEFHPFTGNFYVKIGGIEFRHENYNRLIEMVNHSDIILLNQEALRSDSVSGVQKTKIVRLEYWGSNYYDEENRQHSIDSVYPITKKNKDILDAWKKEKEKGWELIRNSDMLLFELERFPKGYFENIIKKKKEGVR